jgi:hypothetical protein
VRHATLSHGLTISYSRLILNRGLGLSISVLQSRANPLVHQDRTRSPARGGSPATKGASEAVVVLSPGVRYALKGTSLLGARRCAAAVGIVLTGLLSVLGPDS